MSLFEKFMKKDTEEETVSVSDLKRAIKQKEFVFYYQPEFDLKTQKVIAVEALMRWNSPNGIIPPDQFIPVLEKSGLIRQFTEFLLQQTLADLKKIHEIGYPDIVMAVNLSVSQLQDKNLISIVQKVLKEMDVDAKYLEFEVTESQQLSLPDMQESVFQELKNVGVSVSIDDFGTGYSTFKYLRYLEAKKLKVDNDFITSMDENPRSKTILSAIIKLAHDLNTPILAEGVETTPQKEWLEQNGCDYGQGFWFARPLPMDQLIPFLEKNKEK